MLSLGYFKGDGNGNFRPDATLTRAEIVQILYNAYNDGTSGSASFNDTDSNAWYSTALSWAVGKGLVNGYSNGGFGPTDPITREQMSAIMVRAAEKFSITLPETTEVGTFEDGGDIAGYAADAVVKMQKAGIIVGKPGNIFDPQGKATRAETCKIIYMILDYAGKIPAEYKITD